MTCCGVDCVLSCNIFGHRFLVRGGGGANSLRVFRNVKRRAEHSGKISNEPKKIFDPP